VREFVIARNPEPDSSLPYLVSLPLPTGAVVPEPSTADVRTWARAHGLDVPDRGRLRPDVWEAFRSSR
jgi:hypothetical protein